ncbi:MAG: sigma-70 family RNA polymerase sigma factor [Planctomycetota bacterium]
MTAQRGPAGERTQRDDAEDRDAILSVRAGHKECFSGLVTKYMHRAHAIALVIVGDSHDAMDLAQDAFLKSYRSLGSFDIEQPFFPWFYRILRNTCISFIKRHRRLRKISLTSKTADEPDLEIPDASLNPAVLADRTEMTEKFWQAYGRLAIRDREIIALRHFHELSYEQIAQAIDIPIGTVMSRLFHARRRLKERLEHYL